jgi:hypothetical protein
LSTSNVRTLDTAFSWALAHEVTVINSTISNATTPPFPNSALHAYAAGSPDEISALVGTLAYVRNLGLSVNATAASPNVIISPNGIAKHANPPMIQARTAVMGREAVARCEYAWSRLGSREYISK